MILKPLALAGFFIFSISACQTTSIRYPKVAERNPSNTDKPLYLVMAVHGISGTEKTFGALPKVLSTHLSQISPQYNYQVVPFRYETGNHELSTYNFAISLGERIDQELKNRNNPNDRIAIVAHSQGGLVALIWYMKSIYKDPQFIKYTPQALKLDAFITLGTPIWGSRLGNILTGDKNIQFIRNLARKNNISFIKLGQKELEEMAHGSDTIYKFRQAAIQAELMGLDIPARTLGIGGVLPARDSQKIKSLGGIYGLGYILGETATGTADGQRLEGDLAVSIPMSRLNFYYSDPAKTKKETISYTDFKHFKDPRRDNFILLEAPHASWDQKKFLDMAEVPESCLEISQCQHPTYPYILDFIANCSEYPEKCDVSTSDKILSVAKDPQKRKQFAPDDLVPSNLRKFTVDFNLILPDNYDLKSLNSDDLRHYINFFHTAGFINSYGENPNDSSYKAYFGKEIKIASSTYNIQPYLNPVTNKTEQHLRLTLYGTAEPKRAADANYFKAVNEGLKFLLYVRLPGLKVRWVEVKVRPTYTTFVEFDYRN